MDVQRLTTVQADLVAWGILEPGAPRLTRSARAAMARVAALLREEELAGKQRPGQPLMLVATLAIAELAPTGRATASHHQYLAAVELASLPENVQGMVSGQRSP